MTEKNPDWEDIYSNGVVEHHLSKQPEYAPVPFKPLSRTSGDERQKVSLTWRRKLVELKATMGEAPKHMRGHFMDNIDHCKKMIQLGKGNHVGAKMNLTKTEINELSKRGFDGLEIGE